MNIFVPHKWLKEIVEHDLTNKKVEDLLTLRSSSVEDVKKVLDDEVMEVEITTNRGDNLSILGIARELNAICKAEGKQSTLNNPLQNATKINEGNQDLLSINVTDKKINPRFTAVVLKGIKVQPSPKYIQDRLEQVGIRPINNIVDITNYIMTLTGQPMHAFDFNKIDGGVMEVTLSKKGEQLKTLDGVNYKLPENSIIIKDSNKIIDLCGIMGGENSEITNDTTNVVLFTQIYSKTHVRKTSLKLNTRTEAVQRFEKGIDPTIQKSALDLAVNILSENNDFEIASPVYDLNYTDVSDVTATMTFQKLNVYANKTIDPDIAKNILQGLGFVVTDITDKTITVKVPSHRLGDIEIEEDLIEEVIRIYGYENIDLVLPRNHFDDDIFDNTNKVERLVKNYLKSIGFNELITYTMVSKEKVNLKKAVKIDNPLGEQMAYMRTSLKPTMLEALETNKGEVNIFEHGNIYKTNGNKMPIETKKLSILSSSNNHSYKVINIINNICSLLNNNSLELTYKPNNKVLLSVNNNKLGFIKVSSSYTYASLNFKTLVKSYNDYPNVQEPASTATIIEDLTIFIPKTYKAGPLLHKILEADKYLVDVKFKDNYVSKKFRALTLTFYYQDPKENITDEHVATSRNNVIKYIENTLNFKVDRPK